MFARLSEKEERMDLLVKQYKDNGSKILDNLTKKREGQRTNILRNLDAKKKEMTAVYTEANGFIVDTADELKENPVSHFEKEWRKKQDEIRKQIAEGRKLSV